MRKIALLKWSFDKVDGGEKVAVNLANALSNDYEVYLISLNSNNDPFYPLDSKVNYVNLGKGKLRIRNGFLSNTLKLRRFIKSKDIDVIFSIGVSTNIFMLLSTLFTGIKTVFCEHTNTKFKGAGRFFLFQRYLGAKYSNKIVTLTEEDKDNYKLNYSVSEKKITFIYNWIEYSNTLFPYNPNCKRLITVGRFTKQKGYDSLLLIAEKIYEKFPDWQWDIYGDGDDSIKKKLEKAPNICLKGVIKGTENIFPNHAIYVMTSYYEGLPLVLLEAKQFKLPIVSFKCPTGPSEIIRHNENGFLIENYDVNSMVEKILCLIKDSDLRMRFSNNAMLDASKFSKENIIKQWYDLIDDLC